MAKFGLPGGGRRTSQPQYPVRVDQSNPHTGGLVYSFNAGVGPRNTVTPQVTPTLTGALNSFGVGPQGKCLVGTGGDYFDSGATWGMDSAASGTLIVGCAPQNDVICGNRNGATGFQLACSAGNPVFTLFGVADYTCSTTITAGEWIVLALRYQAGVTNGSQFFRNGIPLGNAFTVGTINPSATNLFLASRDTTAYGSPKISFLHAFKTAKTDNEIREISNRPWQIFEPLKRNIYVSAAGGGSPYTMTAASGSFALTGNATALQAARKMTASGGTYILTGNAAALTAARKLAAASGTYTLTGNAAALTAARKLVAASGTFTLTGNAATLTYSPAGYTYTMSAAAGVFTLTGNATALTVARKMTAGAGSYTLTGNAVTFTYATSAWTDVSTASGVWTDASTGSGTWTDKPLSGGTWTDL